MGSLNIAFAEQSRKLLANTDQWKDRIEELSNSECVLRATVLEAERTRDAWVASCYLPDYLAKQYGQERNKRIKEVQDSLPNLTKMLVMQVLPSFDPLIGSELRGVQKHNLLQTLEALRMHAKLSGELPETLENLRPVPALRDPITQKNFAYTRTSPASATIQRAPTRQADPETTIKITLRVRP